MFMKKLMVHRCFLWLLPLLALVGLVARPSSVAALSGAYVVDTATIVPVSNLNLFPPNPCNQGIQLSGDFVIQAHIVYPPEPIFPPEPILPAGTSITLHLDATQISGVGLTDGILYQGTQGTSQEFLYSTDPMLFDTTFDLVPSQPNQFPPNPCSPMQLRFQVQIYTAEGGIPALSVSIDAPDGNK